jgi:uncharacterized membrane protein
MTQNLSLSTTNPFKLPLTILLSLMMVAIGTLHVGNPQPCLEMVPPYLPYHPELVYISGFFEILGGIGILIPLVSRAAAWGLIVLFIPVFPANLHVTVNHIDIEDLPSTPLRAWIRLPFQAVLIAWALWFTRKNFY